MRRARIKGVRRRRGVARFVAGGVGATAAVPLALSPLTGYLLVLTGAAWWARRSGRHVTTVRDIPTTRFAILVPAHNEERLIATTLRSLPEIDYPAVLFEVHVVADHCTDRTVEIVRTMRHRGPRARRSRAGGARDRPLRGCAPVSTNAGTPHDVVVVDRRRHRSSTPRSSACSTPDSPAGDRVVQAHYARPRPRESASAGLRAAALALRHHLCARSAGPRSAPRAACTATAWRSSPTSCDAANGATTSPRTSSCRRSCCSKAKSSPSPPTPSSRPRCPATLEASQTQNERWERGRIDLANARSRPCSNALFEHAAVSVWSPSTPPSITRCHRSPSWRPSPLASPVGSPLPAEWCRRVSCEAGAWASRFALTGLAVHVVLGLRVAAHRERCTDRCCSHRRRSSGR